MKTIWIKRSGSITEPEASELIKEYCSTAEKKACAFYTGRFQSTAITNNQDDRIDRLLEELPLLLELRVFDKESELLLYRSVIGTDFSYRIADDQTLRDNLPGQVNDFLKRAEAHRMEQIQIIDSDTENYAPWINKEQDAFGARLLRTTGGGTYCLPLKDAEDALIVISYISYDENGTASVTDTRWAGFTNEKDWRKSHEDC